MGGSRIGQSFWWRCLNATYPFAQLKVDQDYIELISVGKKYRFNHQTVQEIREFHGLLFQVGLRIKHTNPKYSPFILFWTFPKKTLKPLKEALEEAGFNVSDELEHCLDKEEK